jgi:AraC-like DNA-binding protein
MLLFLVIILCFLLCLIVKLYRSQWKREKSIVHFTDTLHDLKKSLALINGPLNEISRDNNLEESNKNKLHLAIWGVQKAQKTINNLIVGKKIGDKSYIDISNSETAENLKDTQYLQIDQAFMEKMILIIKAHIDDIDFTVDTLSQEIGMSRSSLYHRIKELCNCAPADFIRKFRLEKAKELLETSQYTVSEIAFKTGFSDVKYFRTVFKKEYNNSPRNFTKISQ